MRNTISTLVETASRTEVDKQLNSYAEAHGFKLVDEVSDAEKQITRSDASTQLRETQEYLYSLYTNEDFEGNRVKVPNISMTEALTSTDVSIAFPRVISEILNEPTEPNLFLTNSIAEVIILPEGAPLYIEFPTVGALNASDLSEGQEYPVATVALGQEATSLRIRKTGIASAVTEETIRRSMWPMVALHLRLMANAIRRRIEKNLSDTMVRTAQTVFDNSNTDTAYYTTGKKSDQTANGSFSFNDFIKMAGVLLGNEYEASHLLTHPLAWPTLAQDPIMRAQFYTGGQLGAGIWNRKPSFDQSAAMPFGIAYTPYYNITYTENETLTSTLSAEGAAPITSDFYMIDRANSLFLATYGDIEMDSMENWYKDATQMKARQYNGTAAKDAGRGMIVAKDVRAVINGETLFNIGTLSL